MIEENMVCVCEHSFNEHGMETPHPWFCRACSLEGDDGYSRCSMDTPLGKFEDVELAVASRNHEQYGCWCGHGQKYPVALDATDGVHVIIDFPCECEPVRFVEGQDELEIVSRQRLGQVQSETGPVTPYGYQHAKQLRGRG